MQFEVREGNYGDYLWWHGDVRVPSVSADIDGEPVLFGCVAADIRNPDKYWAFLDVRDEVPPAVGFAFVRKMRSSLRAASTETYTIVDAIRHPTAERLCRLLGFQPTGEMLEEREIWKLC